MAAILQDFASAFVSMVMETWNSSSNVLLYHLTVPCQQLNANWRIRLLPISLNVIFLWYNSFGEKWLNCVLVFILLNVLDANRGFIIKFSIMIALTCYKNNE